MVMLTSVFVYKAFERCKRWACETRLEAGRVGSGAGRSLAGSGGDDKGFIARPLPLTSTIN